MLYNVVVNDWGETTYVPTTLGNVLLIVVLVLVLAAAVAIGVMVSKNKKGSAVNEPWINRPWINRSQNSGSEVKSSKTPVLTAKQLAFCAMAIALGTVLSNIKLFHFPTGGSITLLSMLVICLPGYWFGLGTGVLTGVAYGVLQLLIDPYVLSPAQLAVDYLLAFGALGLSGLFSRAKFGLVKGYIAAVLGRYFFAVLSGWIFFGTYAWEGWSALPYSLVYNAIYIFAEAIPTVAILFIPPVSKTLSTIKRMASE